MFKSINCFNSVSIQRRSGVVSTVMSVFCCLLYIVNEYQQLTVVVLLINFSISKGVKHTSNATNLEFRGRGIQNLTYI